MAKVVVFDIGNITCQKGCQPPEPLKIAGLALILLCNIKYRKND